MLRPNCDMSKLEPGNLIVKYMHDLRSDTLRGHCSTGLQLHGKISCLAAHSISNAECNLPYKLGVLPTGAPCALSGIPLREYHTLCCGTAQLSGICTIAMNKSWRAGMRDMSQTCISHLTPIAAHMP